MKETWKPVKGHEGKYDVSNLGRVRSRTRVQLVIRNDERMIGSYLTTRAGKVLKPGVASNGYLTVALGRGNTRTVHSLVAEAFIGARPEGQEVRHKDGNRENANAVNLCYGTRTDNIKDAVKHGSWMTPARAAHCKRLRSYRRG